MSPIAEPKSAAAERPAGQAGSRGLWSRRWVRYPVYLVAAWLIGCGLLAVGLPLALEKLILPRASETIGRAITADRFRFNPFTLRLTGEGLKIAGPAGATDGETVSIAGLDVDLSARSLRHLAPVIESLKIGQPTVRIRRDAQGRFDFADVLDRIAALPASSEPTAGPARFALNNIELVDGSVTFNDQQLGQTHRVEKLTVGVPFISTLPDDIETFVHPALAAVVNGSPLDIRGESLPFHASNRTDLKVDLRDLALAPYLKLSPTPLGFTLPEGRLTTDLRVRFLREPAGNRLTIDGRAHLDGLAIDAQHGGRLLSVRRLDITLAELQPLAGLFRIGEVVIDAPDVAVTRAADGSLAIARAFGPQSATGAAPATSTRPPATTPPGQGGQGSQLQWSVARVVLKDGRVVWQDQTTTPPVNLEQHAIQVELGTIGNQQPSAAPVSMSLNQGTSGRVEWKGDLDLARSQAGGHVHVRLDSIQAYLPYIAAALGARLSTGPITASTRFQAGWAGPTTLSLADGSAAVDTTNLQLPEDKEPVVRLGRVAVDGLALDLAAEKIDIAKATLAKADVRVLRDAKGHLNLSRIASAGNPAAPASAAPASAAPETAAPATAAPPASAIPARPPSRSGRSTARRGATASAPSAPATPPAAAAPSGSAGWTVAVARLVLDDNRVEWRDLAAPATVTLPITGISGSIDQVGTKLDGRSQADVRATIGRTGQLAAKGGFVVQPLSLDMNLQWRSILLAVFDPYVAERLTVGIQQGATSGNGRLRYGGDRAQFSGRVGIDGLRAAERDNQSELLRWKSLALTDIDVDVATGTSRSPDRVTIGNVALNEFFARVELSSQGRFNLQDVLKPAPSKPGSPAPTGSSATASAPMQIRVGGIRLTGGSSNFTDYFVKPNYSVNLSELTGSVTAMATDAAEPADVLLEGRIDGDAPIKISGKLNPLGPTLYTDIAASAKGIDLPTFTPYSGKYAGYAIEKGKLSLDIRYKIENEKLDATNRVFLDQLTFGQKIDSPDALNLPIQFAIGLLKNSRGEIDISLPIGGSLNDPQFSIGGLVWQAITNLLTKIITAPFAALASVFGGGEELSFVEFRPGTAEFADGSSKRLETIGKALTDRPALKLEIAGRMDPATEAEAFGRARLEERLRALRADGGRDRKDTDSEKAGVGGPAVPADQRPALLKRLAATLPAAVTEVKADAKAADAKSTESKAAGLKSAATKADPTTETSDMAALEQRLIKQFAADTEAQRLLATRRSQIARDWLTANGKIPGERIFLLAPRVGSGDRSDSQKPTCTAACAEFSLR